MFKGRSWPFILAEGIGRRRWRERLNKAVMVRKFKIWNERSNTRQHISLCRSAKRNDLCQVQCLMPLWNTVMLTVRSMTRHFTMTYWEMCIGLVYRDLSNIFLYTSRILKSALRHLSRWCAVKAGCEYEYCTYDLHRPQSHSCLLTKPPASPMTISAKQLFSIHNSAAHWKTSI